MEQRHLEAIGLGAERGLLSVSPELGLKPGGWHSTN